MQRKSRREQLYLTESPHPALARTGSQRCPEDPRQLLERASRVMSQIGVALQLLLAVRSDGEAWETNPVISPPVRTSK